MKKNRITKIWSVSLAVMLLVSLLFSALPASASNTLDWEAEDIPDDTGFVILASDVKDIAVAADGQTIYAAIGTTTLYKSTDAGVSWVELTDQAVNSDFVAIAPDDDDIVAYANAGTPAVYVSTNGGSSFSTLGTIQEQTDGTAANTLTDLAISAAASGKNYVGVSGYEANNNANLWYFNVGHAAPVWKETNDKEGFNSDKPDADDATGSANVTAALAFSPNFASDLCLTAIVSNYYAVATNNGTAVTCNVTYEIFSTSSKKWNTAAGLHAPVSLHSDDGITAVTAADISLAPTYLAGDDTERIAFVGMTLAGNDDAQAENGLIRIKNTTIEELKTGATIDVNSVAYDGTNLVAGRYDNNYVYRCADALDSSPTVSTASSLKRPAIETSGTNEKVIVRWAGSDVVAATSGDESCFSVSSDNGKTFSDISLIDTATTTARDMAVSTDGSRVYWVTDDNSDTSVWRMEDGAWTRVLTIADDTNYLVRTAPDNADSLYVAQSGGTTVYYSAEGGDTKWFTRTCGVTIQDLAIESADVAYAVADNGDVTESTNAGFTWATSEACKLGNAATIISVAEDTVVVGGTTGYVAYSTDGNDSWTKISKITQTGADLVQVAADADL
ncbi:WD40/YVTN/BNR-like repeat-containing protein, partial [Chloroflexota bacterium]